MRCNNLTEFYRFTLTSKHLQDSRQRHFYCKNRKIHKICTLPFQGLEVFFLRQAVKSKVNQAIVLVLFASGTSPKTSRKLFMAENKMTRRARYGHIKYRYFSFTLLLYFTLLYTLLLFSFCPWWRGCPSHGYGSQTAQVHISSGFHVLTTLRTVHLISFFILRAFCFADRGPRCIESEFVFVRDPSQSVLWDPMLVCVCYIINSYYEGFCWFYMDFWKDYNLIFWT